MSRRLRRKPRYIRSITLLLAICAVAAFIFAQRGRPWWVPSDAVRIGGAYVRHDLGVPLVKAEEASPEVWGKCLREGRFVQGYGTAWESNGTHRHGWCLDIATGGGARWTWRGLVTYAPLSAAEIRKLVGALEAAGFAAPLRVVGYDLGKGIRVPRGAEHIHAVYNGHENYSACRAATRPGGRAAIDRMLNAR